MKKGILVSLFWYFVFVPSALAVTTTILNSPSTIGEDKFEVTVSIDGASAGTNYLRVDLYVAGTKNYFGETDNTQSWYGGSDGKQYYPVTIESNTILVATVSARLGEPTHTDYPGPGDYLLRVRRYTASGNQGSEEVAPAPVKLTKTWPSPSPSPVPTPSPTPTPPPTPASSPTPTPTPPPTQKPSPTLISSPSLDPSPPTGTVAGDSTLIDLSTYGVSPSPSSLISSPKSTELSLNPSRLRFAIIVGSGLSFLSLAGYLTIRFRRIQ